MKKDLIIAKCKKTKLLYRKGWSLRKISRHLVASINSVRKWIKIKEDEVSTEKRGWKKGRLRKNSTQARERIKNIREQLIKENSYFYGAKIVRNNYENLYGEKVSQWFVNNTLKQYGMVKSPQPKKAGKSKYMHYPVHTLNKLCKTLMSIDFIGPKYLHGSGKRINFLSCKYIRPYKA